MPSEVQRIPPAPRRVLWRRVLGYRWPLAALTFVLAVYGGVVTWMLFLANSNKMVDAERLRQGPLTQIAAVVTAVAATGTGTGSRAPVQHVDYEFHSDGQNWSGDADVPGGGYLLGQAVQVEFLRGQPSLNRIAGSPPDLRADLFDPGDSFALVVVPGLLVFLGYLAGVFHLRRVLGHGDVSLAQLLSIRRVRFCLPETFAVRFQFRDHGARERIGHHWVRAHSMLGQRLLTMLRHGNLDKVPVLHDRRHPLHCRLVLPEDFSPDPHPTDPAATIRL